MITPTEEVLREAPESAEQEFELQGADKHTFEEQEFLTGCMMANIEHARHIENERMTFISLLLVSIGMILEGSASMTPLLRSVMAGILLLMNVVCTCLLRRWDLVYTRHMNLAELMLGELLSMGAPLPSNTMGTRNRLYLFGNRQASWLDLPEEKRRVLEGKKGAKIDTDGVSSKFRYTGTSRYFYIFNGLIYVVILIFLLAV